MPLKKKGLYFNALANDKRKAGSGGPYIPEDNSFLQDKEVSEKVSRIFKAADDLEYYREVMSSVPIGKPVWSLWVSSSYGRRTDPFKKTKAYHKGVDLAGRTGNKIKVMAKGKVTRAGTASGYGNLVEVDHGNGFKTKYGHMHKIYVKKASMWKRATCWAKSVRPGVRPDRTCITRFCTRGMTLTRCLL